MSSIVIVGDGPAGLSAALFLAKNGQDVTVFGDDETAMHYALLKNYLGVEEQPGSDFQERALSQVTAAGAALRRNRVSQIEPTGPGFTVTDEDGVVLVADYLVLAEGKTAPLATALGLAQDDSGAIEVDRQFRTSLDRVYAAGRAVRPTRSQAIISAGAGATAALDIMAEITGGDFRDWDSVPSEG